MDNYSDYKVIDVVRRGNSIYNYLEKKRAVKSRETIKLIKDICKQVVHGR